ncbi:hypothetical protein [Agrobacterium tumefaciens]|uniref:Uncharacterized protein n=1 Tax=Agrobacterium tumefaciens TaxID=358 RepID=A0A176XIA1_AGRTU|nr:hypothetical protein [Agrobacterium tumefaciens]OAE48911.1 hypothetical protein A7J57_20405 [Agrobacterium tumefaciens]
MFPFSLTKAKLGLDPASLADVAAILFEDQACLEPIVEATDETDGGPKWIVLAIIHALWRKAGVAPRITSCILKAWPEILTSLEQVMCFRADAAAEETDPFQFYHPLAAHSIPVLGLDEYIDVVDNRFLVWRRPTIDRISLGKALIASPRTDNDEVYLDALRALQARPTYQSTGLGFMDGSTFFHNKCRRKFAGQTLASSVLGSDHPGLLFDNGYVCKTSINVSISVRVLKRAAQGLNVRR